MMMIKDIVSRYQ